MSEEQTRRVVVRYQAAPVEEEIELWPGDKIVGEGIWVNPDRLMGEPAILGHRISVSQMLGAMAGGDSIDQLMDSYQLTRDEILACFNFAAELIRHIYNVPIDEPSTDEAFAIPPRGELDPAIDWTV